MVHNEIGRSDFGGLNNHAYSSCIQKCSDQSILSIGSDNPPTEVISAGFVTHTVPFENVKWCKRRTVRAILGQLNDCAIILRTQNSSDHSISSIGCDNLPTEVIIASFVTCVLCPVRER